MRHQLLACATALVMTILVISTFIVQADTDLDAVKDAIGTVQRIIDTMQRIGQILSDAKTPVRQAVSFVVMGMHSLTPEDSLLNAQAVVNLLEGSESEHFDPAIDVVVDFDKGVCPHLAQLNLTFQEWSTIEDETSSEGMEDGWNRYLGLFRLASEAMQDMLAGNADVEDAFLTAHALLSVAQDGITRMLQTWGFEIWVSPGESIQAVIDQAREGATIYIEPGVYRETLGIDKSITLDGAAFEMPEQLSGGRIRYGVSLQPIASQAGIVIDSIEPIYVNIRQMAIESASQGIEITGNAHVVVEQVVITESGTGVDVSDSASLEMSDCYLEFNGTAVSSRGGNVIASSCTFSDNTRGVSAYFGASCTLIDCVIERCVTPEEVMAIQDAISAWCTDLTLENCVIRDNQGTGVTLGGGEASRLHMTGCQLIRNAYGLELVFGSCNPGDDPEWEAPTHPAYKSHGTLSGWNNTIPGPDEPDANLLGAIDYYYRDYLDPSFLTEPAPDE